MKKVFYGFLFFFIILTYIYFFTSLPYIILSSRLGEVLIEKSSSNLINSRIFTSKITNVIQLANSSSINPGTIVKVFGKENKGRGLTIVKESKDSLKSEVNGTNEIDITKTLYLYFPGEYNFTLEDFSKVFNLFFETVGPITFIFENGQETYGILYRYKIVN